MRIIVTYAPGEGVTKLAACDRALWNGGIGNYNLIKISSVIPKNAEIAVQKLSSNHTVIGHKLYVVIGNYIEHMPVKRAANCATVNEEKVQYSPQK